MSARALVLILILISLDFAPAQPSVCMYTIAGTGGSNGFTGDGGPATSATLNKPRGVALYRGGYLISDESNHAVRWVNATSGVMSTHVGTGVVGYSGDNGPASAATLNYPKELVLFGGGFLLADPGNNVIRFISGSDVISTWAGTGMNAFSGDNGPATSAAMKSPASLVLNGTAVIIADTFNYRLRRVAPGGVIRTIAGTGIGALSGTTSGDGGAATSATIGTVFGMVMYAGGLLFSDFTLNRVRRVDARGIITTIAGGGAFISSGPATSTSLKSVTGLASKGDWTFILADSDNYLIRFVDASATISTIAGTSKGYSGDGGAALSAQMFSAISFAFDSSGGLLFADYNNHAVRYMTPAGMCLPRVNCTVADPLLLCTFNNIAPYLYVNASLSGAPCSLLQAPPSTTRNATCVLPFSNTATLTWSAGNVMSSMMVVNTAFGASSAPSSLPNTTCAFGWTSSSFDLNGGDLSIVTAADAAACQSLCCAAQGCNGYSHGVGTTRCVLKSCGWTLNPGGASVSGLLYSVSNSTAVTLTCAPSPTAQAIATASASITPSASVSASGTWTPNALTSSTSTVSESWTACTICSLTSTPSESMSPTHSASASASVSATGTGSLSASSTGTCRSSTTTTSSSSDGVTLGSTVVPSRLQSSLSSATFTAVSSTSSVSTSTTSAESSPSSSSPPSAGPSESTVTSSAGASMPELVSGSGSSTQTSSVSAPPGVSQAVSSSISGSPAGTITVSVGVASFSNGPSGAQSVTSTPTKALPISASSTDSGNTAATSGSSSATSYLISSQLSTVISSAGTAAPSTTVTHAPAQAAPLLAVFALPSAAPLTTLNGPLLLRDVDAPMLLTARTSGCPSSCTLSCSSSNMTVSRVYPSTSRITDSTDSSVLLWAAYAAVSTSIVARVTCIAQRVSDAALSPRTSFDVRVTPLPLPLLTDVLLHASDQSLARSVWSTAPCNITQAIFRAGWNASAAATAVAASSRLFASSTSLTHVLDTALLVSCAQSQRPPAVPVYRLTCNGGSNLTLVTSGTFNSSATLVRIAQSAVMSSRVSADGRLMHIQLPSSLSLCGSFECGYVPFTIETNGVSLTCPGCCASAPGFVPICATTSSLSTRSSASESSCVAAASSMDGTSPPSVVDVSPTAGLFITSKCTGLMYTDPATGACTNVSDPSFARCAFGAGDGCSICPANAICPGGYRAWPLPGYYTPSEASALILACPLPAQRCSGWDTSLSLVICGVGYRERSYMCSACAHGFFAYVDGSCVPCPSTPTLAASVTVFVLFVAYMSAALLVTYLLMLVVAVAMKSRTDDIHARLGALVAWSFVTVQLVAQAGSSAAAGLPAHLLTMYSALAVARFSGVTLPSSCVTGYAFSSEMTSMCIGLAALLGAIVLSGAAFESSWLRMLLPRAYVHAHAVALRACITLLTLVYPALVSSALSLVVCTSVKIPVLAYISLDGDGSTLMHAGITVGSAHPSALVDVLVQASNPSRVCYESSHTAAAAIAWVSLIAVGAAYPLVCVWCIYLRVRVLHTSAAEIDASVFKSCSHDDDHGTSANRIALNQTCSAALPVAVISPTGIDRRVPARSSVSPGRHTEARRSRRKDDEADGATGTAAALESQTRPNAQGQGADGHPLETSVTLPGKQTPMGIVSRLNACSLSQMLATAACADRSEHVIHDALLAAFMHGDYRPGAFVFYAIDRFVLLAMNAVTATLRSTTDGSTVIARAILVLAVLLANLMAILWCAPFHEREWWRLVVKLLAILLSAAITALNAMTNSLALPASAASDSMVVTVGAYVVFSLCVCLLAALPLTFLLNALHPRPRLVLFADLDALRAAVASLQRTRLTLGTRGSWSRSSRVPAALSAHGASESDSSLLTRNPILKAGLRQCQPAFTRASWETTPVAGVTPSGSRVRVAVPPHTRAAHIFTATDRRPSAVGTRARSSVMIDQAAVAFATSLSFAVPHAARVRRVSRMSITLQAAACTESTSYDAGSSEGVAAPPRRRDRGSIAGAAQFATSLSHAASRRQSGLVRMQPVQLRR